MGDVVTLLFYVDTILVTYPLKSKGQQTEFWNLRFSDDLEKLVEIQTDEGVYTLSQEPTKSLFFSSKSLKKRIRVCPNVNQKLLNGEVTTFSQKGEIVNNEPWIFHI